MTNIPMASTQQTTFTLDNHNQLCNADRLVREWAISHAGPYREQAREELAGSGAFREWRRNNLTIRISMPQSPVIKQAQIVSVRYEPPQTPTNRTEPYFVYLMTYTPAAPAAAEWSGGYFMCIRSMPDYLDDAELQLLDEGDGPGSLEDLFAAIYQDIPRLAEESNSRPTVSGIDDLFRHHETAIVLTEDGRQDSKFQEVANEHRYWAAVISISASEQIAISRELPDHQLAPWVRAKIAVFSRYDGPESSRLRMVETDSEKAADFLAEAEARAAGDIANHNCLFLLEMLEAAADNSPPPPDAATAEAPALKTIVPDNVAAQQRIYVLEDQLSKAESDLAELRSRLAKYESYDTNTDDQPKESEPPTPEAIANVHRHKAVLDAIINTDKFPRLRFLTNCVKPLEDYGKPRPNGVEILKALAAINTLAQAWYNSPSGNIGPWDNYFIGLPGWKHADDESEATMSRFGEKRSFSDQEKGRHRRITRHLTYQGSSGGLQIYFDRDDVTDTFIVGYIGEHLPYATNRS